MVESEKNIELNMITGDNVATTVDEASIAAVVAAINKEKEEAEAAKKKKWRTRYADLVEMQF